EGATNLDGAIGGEADRAGRGVVLLANKWDLVKERDRDVAKTFDDETRRRMRFLDYAPILHISASTVERGAKVIETMDRVSQARRSVCPRRSSTRCWEPSRRNILRSAPVTGTSASCTAHKLGSRRRPSCSSPTLRRRCIFPTSGSSSTSSVSASGSWGRRFDC